MDLNSRIRELMITLVGMDILNRGHLKKTYKSKNSLVLFELNYYTKTVKGCKVKKERNLHLLLLPYMIIYTYEN